MTITPPTPDKVVRIGLRSLAGAEVALMRDKAGLDVLSARLAESMETANALELGYVLYTIAEWRSGNRVTFEEVFESVPVLDVVNRFELYVEEEEDSLPPDPAGG